MQRALILLVVLAGVIQAVPLTVNQNPFFGSSTSQGSTFNNFFNNGNKKPGNFFGGQSTGNIGTNFDSLKKTLQGILANMTLPGGQSATVGFTNLFTIITNFLKAKGGTLQDLIKNGNLQSIIRNATGINNFNLSEKLGNLNGGLGGQNIGNSRGTKIGTTNLMSVLMGSLGNNGKKAGSGGTGQGISSTQQGGLLGGFAGTNTGGFFNRGG